MNFPHRLIDKVNCSLPCLEGMPADPSLNSLGSWAKAVCHPPPHLVETASQVLERHGTFDLAAPRRVQLQAIKSLGWSLDLTSQNRATQCGSRGVGANTKLASVVFLSKKLSRYTWACFFLSRIQARGTESQLASVGVAVSGPLASDKAEGNNQSNS